jgi:hypothetical protein
MVVLQQGEGCPITLPHNPLRGHYNSYKRPLKSALTLN